MARILITGSTDGLGYTAAENLLAQGHDVTVHARNQQRLETLQGLQDRGATALIGDLAEQDQIHDVADQANQQGSYDAVIHNAGVISGQQLLPVNVVAPYLLTVTMQTPTRLLYLSSGLHRGGTATLQGLDWNGSQETASYSDTKLLVTALAFAIARYWPEVESHVVDPGWVPTKMGGPSATDSFRDGTQTQEWLAVGQPQESGSYWLRKQLAEPLAVTRDEQFQDQLLATLAEVTGAQLPGS